MASVDSSLREAGTLPARRRAPSSARHLTHGNSTSAKKELIHRRSWPTKAELRTEVFNYIEVFYNRQR